MVHKLRLRHEDNKIQLAKYENWLWLITKFHLGGSTALESLDEGAKAFALKANPLVDQEIPLGSYHIGQASDNAHCYRLGHPLAQHIIASCKSLGTPTGKLSLGYTASGKRVEMLEPLRGKSGWLRLSLLSLESGSSQDHLVFAAATDDAEPVSDEQCRRMFSLPATAEELTGDEGPDRKEQLVELFESRKRLILEEAAHHNENVLRNEQAKYKTWGKERGYLTKEREQLSAIDQQIATAEKEAKLTNSLRDKLRLAQQRRDFEKQREVAWKRFDATMKQILAEAQALSARSAAKLEFRCQEQELFTLRWQIV